MRFDILRNQDAIARRREELQGQWAATTANRGALVRYEMPALPRPFPQLGKLLENSKYPQEFLGISYYIETKDRRLRRLLPASEYYKFVFRAVADKLYSVRVGYQRVRALEKQLEVTYLETRELMPRTGQPSVRLTDQVYALKSELASVLFMARGIPDTIASLLHFLYGPSSNQFTSFADFIRNLKSSREKKVAFDQDMLSYIEASMEWFYTVRDYRDYVTHTSSIDVSFYEPGEGQLVILLQDALEPGKLVEAAVMGVHDLCEFVDSHFARRLGGVTSVGAA